MTAQQKATAQAILQHNLETHTDWIVLKNTTQTLCTWAQEDRDLAAWLIPHLKRLSEDRRKTVAGAAKKALGDCQALL